MRLVRRLILLSVVLYAGQAAGAAENSEAFLQGLRDRGLDDVAAAYVERMETSPLADEEFRRRIPYYRGVLQIEQARKTLDAKERAAILDRAQRELTAYAQANPNNVDAMEAQSQLASVLVERAQQSLSEVKKLPDSTSAENERRAARGYFVDAADVLRTVEAFYEAEIGKFPKNLDATRDGDQFQMRQEYRGRLAQTQVLLAQLQFEKAQTYPPSSGEFRKLTEEARDDLAKLFETYSRWLVGFYAHLYEGRCYQALGEYRRAMGCYEDLMAQTTAEPAFRRLIAMAYRYHAECLIEQKEYDSAIARLTTWLEQALQIEETAPEWLAARYQLAEAYRKQAEALDAKSPQRRGFLDKARENYSLVAYQPGEFQRDARQAVASQRTGPSRTIEPKTFAEAYNAGKDALAEMNAAKISINAAEANNPQGVADLKAQAEDAQNTAREYFRLATLLVDDDTDEAELNELRYYLCWLYWDQGDYYRAAALGEFLAQRYSDHSAAPAAAKIAMASYERIHNQPGTDDATADFSARRMADMAEFITRRWPGTPDADNALAVLVTFALQHNRVDDASRLLKEVSPERRVSLELRLGIALWAEYLKKASRDDATDAELAPLQASAIQYLENGLVNARKAREVTPAAATAALYLVQANLARGDTKRALALLEDHQVSPLTLVADRNPATDQRGYATETYKAALRTYVSADPPQMIKAVGVLKQLQQSVADDGEEGSSELMRVAIGLGAQLQEQIGQFRDSGQNQEADRLSKAFGDFLEQVSIDSTDASWNENLWLAQTYVGQAEALAGGSSSSEATEYYQKACAIYREMISRAESDPAFAPNPQSVQSAHLALGNCLRSLNKYKEALDEFVALLREKEARLDVQRAAASTYQAWGEAEDAQWLERAIYGGRKVRSTGKNRVWGWLKLAQVAQRASQAKPEFREAFFEARLHAAECRYLVALKSKGEDRQRHLETAKHSIRSMAELYPDLGGEPWQSKFESLLKQIQRAEGREPEGLQEFSAATPAKR